MLVNEIKDISSETLTEESKVIKELKEEFKRLADKVNEVIASHNNSINLLEELIERYSEINFELKYKQELLARIIEHVLLEKNVISKEEYGEFANLYAKQLKDEILANAKKDNS